MEYEYARFICYQLISSLNSSFSSPGDIEYVHFTDVTQMHHFINAEKSLED